MIGATDWVAWAGMTAVDDRLAVGGTVCKLEEAVVIRLTDRLVLVDCSFVDNKKLGQKYHAHLFSLLSFFLLEKFFLVEPTVPVRDCSKRV